MTRNYEYKVGGSLGENAPSYVTRQADFDLYHSLKAGEFCYIFNSRQMGKTSLIVRTMNKLQAEGFACTSLDFSVRGSRDIKSEQWYAGIVYKLTNNFNLANPSDILRIWWQERGAITPVERLEEFIETVLLASIQSKIVIFIDEIDSILSLGFPTDDFFALIRSCYEKRNFNPEYRRLTFALVGVVTPSDLIADKRRTPFNIGKAIQLEGFKDSEIEPLAQGFSGYVENPLVLMQEVLSWTGGQPFLTQKICQLIIQKLPQIPPQVETSDYARSLVEAVIRSKMITNWEANDEPEHIKTIRDRMLLGEQVAGRFLGWYQQILLSGYIHVDESIEQIRFRLTGLVVKQQNILKVYNRIYESVLNLTWVERELRKLRPYSENFQAWIDSHYRDESRLLRGQALQSALQWATQKSLSNEDSRYLAASQELEKRELEASLAVKEEEGRILSAANETLSHANKKLSQAQNKSRKMIRFGSTFLVVSIIVIIIGSMGALWFGQKLIEDAKTATVLEREAGYASEQFNNNQNIEALLTAINAAQNLQKLAGKNAPIAKYPVTSPIIALNDILYHIQERNQLKGHTAHVYNANFSPDGKTIVTASQDRTVKVWSSSGQEIATLKGHTDTVFNANFSPDGKTIVTASTDKTAKVWSSSGQEIATLNGHTDSVNNANFSPDGKKIVTASTDKTTKVWSSSGQEIATLKGHTDGVINANFSPDGKKIVTASTDKTTKVWSSSGEEKATLKGHTDGVINANFSPDGKKIVTASADKTAKVWSSSGEEKATLKGHTSAVYNANFSPDGKTIVTTSPDGTVKIWSSSSGEEKATLKGHTYWVNNANFSPDGKTIVTASLDGTVKIWSSSSGEEKATLKGHTYWVNNANFSPDGKTIITASQDKTAKVWSSSGEEKATLKGHRYTVYNANFSPDGKTIVTASDDGTAKVWSSSGQEIATLKVYRYTVNNANFSPDGKTIVTASDDGTAKVWSSSGQELATLKGHTDNVVNANFSPDGKTIVTASDDKTAKVWSSSGQKIATLKGHTQRVNNANFSPDGKTIVTASNDKTAKVWSSSGQEIATLKGHTDSVNNANFSPDGKTIVTASNDKTAKVWSSSGQEIATLKGHTDSVNNANFSPDGKTIVTASNDKTAKVWRWKELGELLKTGCEWLNDYLIINPTELQKLEVCQTPAKLKDAAPFLLKAGEAEAKVGNIEKAIATFKTAFKWNPELTKFDPQQKAQEFKNKAEAERLVIDANRFVEEKKIKEAVAAYNQAQKLDPKVEIDANAWAYLCRQGSIYESAKEVMFACEKAVKLDPNNVIIRSVRGFARALTGDYFGAITDFEVYIAQTDDKKYKALMQEYVKVLRTGKNPFTQSELKKLREE